MKRASHETEGDTDVESLFDVLSSAEWASQLAAQLHDDSELISRTVGDDGSVALVMSRRTEALPGFIAKVAPSDLKIVTSDSWGPSRDGVRECTWTAEIPGTPVRIRGTQRIEPSAAGSRHLTSAEVSVSVPLLGGKIEGFIVEQIQRIAREEEEVVRSVLSARQT